MVLKEMEKPNGSDRMMKLLLTDGQRALRVCLLFRSPTYLPEFIGCSKVSRIFLTCSVSLLQTSEHGNLTRNLPAHTYTSDEWLPVYKEDMEEGEMDIEIGLPTDVKHVGHIGWDGCTSNSDHPSKSCSWDNLFIDPDMNMLSNKYQFQQLASPSPSPTASGLEPLEGRPQNLQTSNPKPCADPIPLKG